MDRGRVEVDRSLLRLSFSFRSFCFFVIVLSCPPPPLLILFLTSRLDRPALSLRDPPMRTRDDTKSWKKGRKEGREVDMKNRHKKSSRCMQGMKVAEKEEKGLNRTT